MSSTRLLRPFLSRNHLPPRTRLDTRLRTSTTRLYSSWSPSPAPPRLPKEDQDLFERLQQRSTGAFSTPVSSNTPDDSKASHMTETSTTSATVHAAHSVSTDEANTPSARLNARVDASGQGHELHPDIRRGAKDEFDGDTNPVTGEVGGPKREPLRWGHEGDWSYNGRVTDF